VWHKSWAMRAIHDRGELWDRLTLLLITSAREGWELEFEEITRREIERLCVPDPEPEVSGGE
jgi:hypothetical protein